jgi:signal transduction histidine kinase
MKIQQLFWCIACFLMSYILFAQPKVDSLEIYENDLDYAKAIRFVNHKNTILLQQKKWEEYQQLNIRLSKIYTKLNDPQRSIETLYKCIQTLEKNSKTQIKPELFLEMGTSYSLIQDTLKAKSYYHKSSAFARKQKNNSALRNVYQNLFRLWAMSDLDSAKYYLNKKHELDKIDNDPGGLSTTYNNYFAFYTLVDDYPMAKKYADSAYSLAKKHQINHAMITALTNYGYYYIVEKNDYKTALKYYLELEENYGKEMTSKDLGNLYLNLGHVYVVLKDDRNSNHYHYMYIELSQQLTNERVNDAVKAIEMRYQIEKVEDEYKAREAEIRKAQARKELLFYIIGALLILAIILGYFFYQNQKLKQKNTLKEIENKRQKELMNAMWDGQENERKSIAMVLHDQISSTLASVGLHISALKVRIAEEMPEIEKSKSLLINAQEQVRGLSHKLLPPVLAKLGFVEAVHSICTQNTTNQIGFTFENKLKNEPNWGSDWDVKMYGMVLELCQNIIKHSQASQATIILNETTTHYSISVTDNGVGIAETKIKNSGLGLTQIKNRIEFYDGKMTVNSLKPGTQITLILPKKLPSNT